MKKKIMLITVVAVIIALAAAGTAFAANGYGTETGEPMEAADGTGYGRRAERGTGQRFAVQAENYESEEEFHKAILAQKLAIIETKVADGSLSEEDAASIREHLTACDGTCETEGENPNRPEDGWGIFGQGLQSGKGGNRGNAGSRGNGGQMRGNGSRSENCELEEPLEDGSGKPE